MRDADWGHGARPAAGSLLHSHNPHGAALRALLLLDGLQLIFQLLLPDSSHEAEVQADEGFPQGRVHPAAHNLVRGIGDSVRKERHVLRQLLRFLLIALRRGDSSCHMLLHIRWQCHRFGWFFSVNFYFKSSIHPEKCTNHNRTAPSPSTQ